MTLQLIFGMTMTNLSMYLCCSCWLMDEIFNQHHLTEILVTSEKKNEEYKRAMHAKHAHLENIWCMDGLKLYLEQKSSSKV